MAPPHHPGEGARATMSVLFRAIRRKRWVQNERLKSSRVGKTQAASHDGGQLRGQKMNVRERLEAADRQHLLVHSFLPRIDSKVSALFAVVSGELAVLCLNITKQTLTTWWTAVPLVIAVGLIATTVVYLYKCAFPHLDGGHSSLIYFAEVSKRTEAKFLIEWKNADADKLTDDILGQIWANSVIVCKKFRFLKIASITLASSLLPWGLYLAGSAFLTAKMITIST